MTNVQRREVTRRTVEYVVPAAELWGACWNEVSLAIHQATQELRGIGLCPADREPADDQIRVHPTDEAVIVAIELRAETSYRSAPSPERTQQ